MYAVDDERSFQVAEALRWDIERGCRREQPQGQDFQATDSGSVDLQHVEVPFLRPRPPGRRHGGGDIHQGEQIKNIAQPGRENWNAKIVFTQADTEIVKVRSTKDDNHCFNDANGCPVTPKRDPNGNWRGTVFRGPRDRAKRETVFVEDLGSGR